MAPCFWKIFEKSNQPSQQLSLWMKQWTFHYSKFVVNSNALKTDKIPNFANLSAPNSEKNHPSTTKKRRPCATRKPQLLPKVQQTTLHPCTKGTSMRHNVVCFETTISSKKSYTYPKFLHGWNLKMFFFWKGHFFFESHHLQVPAISFSEVSLTWLLISSEHVDDIFFQMNSFVTLD